MNILYITSFIPKKNAAQAGINVSFDIIKKIKENVNCEIDICGLINSHQYDEGDILNIKKYCKEAMFIPVSKFGKIKNVIRNFNTPLIASVRYDKKLEDYIIIKLKEKFYDYIVCDYTQNSKFLYKIKDHSPKSKVVVIEHDVCFQNFERKIQSEDNPLKRNVFKLEYKRLKKYETKLLRDADEIITLNFKDANIISKYSDVKVLVPYINRMEFEPQKHDGINICFWGAMNRSENVDAVKYFVNEIWPKVDKNNIKLWVIGAEPPQDIVELNSDKIIVTGFVEDPKDYFNKMDISIIPLRLGAGIKIKVLESLAAGIAVITTDVGVEGIEVVNNEEIIIENDPNEFAKAINLLAKDKELREKISKKGKEKINRIYDNNNNGEIIKEIFSGS